MFREAACVVKEISVRRGRGVTTPALRGNRQRMQDCDNAMLIFSKDRPLQLDAALRSWKRHCRDAASIRVQVLFKASTSRLLAGYRQCRRDHPEVDFVRETNFRGDVRLLLQGWKCVCLAVDDTVFLKDFSMGEIARLLNRNPDILGFSLRLGRNTTYCYTRNELQRLPEFQPVSDRYLKWNWPTGEGDFGYALEVSSSVYRAAQILDLLDTIEFKNPNSMEEMMFQNLDRFRQSHPGLLSFEKSAAFSIPANKVQQVCNNRVSANAAYSPDALAQIFAAGGRIQTELLDGFVPDACHQEVDIKTGPSGPAVPAVSIIIPCYKQAHYLPEAVGSVVAQTFTDWEIIIVDDGSPDQTAAAARQLMKQYPDRRLRLLEKKNGGLAHARNAGIGAAAGAYILPLDADDKIAPAMLEKTVALLDNNPGVAIAYTDVAHFGAVEKTIQAAEFDFKKLCLNNQLNYCSLYRREAWERAGGYNSNMIWGYEDWDFWISCGEQGLRAQRIPGALLQYRVKDSSMYTEAVARDKELRARIVLNHSSLYDLKMGEDARRLWSGLEQHRPPGAPMVSVVIPTWNRPDRLAEALRSVLNQSFQDFEIIVVNDNGLDVQHVIDRFNGDGRIRYLPRAAVKGIAHARNRGARVARGKYIIHLDDDDIFLREHLETLAGVLEQTGNKAAYSDAWRVEETPSGGRFTPGPRSVVYSSDWDSDHILEQNFVPTLCMMYDRALGIAAGEFDPALTTHEDWDYWIRLSRLTTPLHVKKATCEYRVRADGSSMTSGRREDFLRTAKIIFRKYRGESAGKPAVRQGQRRALRHLKRELRRARLESANGWLKAVLGRFFRWRAAPVRL